MTLARYIITLLVSFTISYAQESTLRPRTQLAQVKGDLEGLLASLNASTVSQGHQSIRHLQNQMSMLEQKNQALSQELETLRTHHKQLKECPKKMSLLQSQVEKLKKQINGYRDRLRKIIDKISEDIA